jgi:hypothetical protein
VESRAIPGEPNELSPAWLTMALRAAGVIRASAVSDRSVETIGTDRGFTGIVARVDHMMLRGRERALVEALITPGLVFAACVDDADRLAALA